MIVNLLGFIALFASSSLDAAVTPTSHSDKYYYDRLKARNQLYDDAEPTLYPFKEGAIVPCGEYFTHKCASEAKCIAAESVCDGIVDCGDLSDEQDCPESIANYEDDVYDEDEEDQEVPDAEEPDLERDNDNFTSTTPTPTPFPAPISASDYGICREDSDQENCKHLIPILITYEARRLNSTNSAHNSTCRDKWQCRDGTCISYDVICDRTPDCPDGSDELWTLCETTSPLANVVFVYPGSLKPGQSPVSPISHAAGSSVHKSASEAVSSKLPQLPPKEPELPPKEPELPQLPPEEPKLPQLPPEEPELPQLPPAKPKLPQLPPSKPKLPQLPAAKPELPPVESELPQLLPDDDDDTATSSFVEGVSQASDSSSPRHCKLVPHVSVKYECLDNNKATRECSSLEPAGTDAIPRCRLHYYSPQVLQPMHCVDGFWDYIARCTPDCGRLSTTDLTHTWPAAIYRKTAESHRRLCAGTLVSNSVVISAARCFWSGSAALPTSEFLVAVGMKHQRLDDPKDKDAQKSDVQNIILPPRFRGADRKFQDDIAIVVVSSPFEYNAGVGPACIDFDISFDAKQLDPGNRGQIAGWWSKDNDETLRERYLGYVNVTTCIMESALVHAEFITSDKICAGTPPESALCETDIGTGYVFPDAERYEYRHYLRGVASFTLDKDGCNHMQHATFTQLLKHKSFIDQYWSDLVALDNSRSAVSKPQTGSSKCLLPPAPAHGTYIINATVLGNDTGGDSYELVTLNVTCQPGYGVQGPSSVNCYNGFWPDRVPQCIQLCALPAHPSVEYRCLLSGAEVGSRVCREHEPPGAVVSPRCREPHYYSATPLAFMRCRPDARWNYVAKCKPDCGRATPVGRELAAGGADAQRGELPWHVGVYDKLTRPYMQVCGGSLISNDLVISAAHCFWKGRALPESQFSVAAGKLYRPWNDPVDVAQKSDLKRIHMPSRFRGTEANFQDDIAVLIVDRPFEYKSYIRPVCLSFDTNFERRQLQTINKGKVAGWGLTGENGKAAPKLQVLELPYVEVDTCIAESPAAFVQYITSDKICAGTKEPDTALCRGDSGGGLVFPATDSYIERYYLRGVVSTAATDDNNNACNTRTYTSFTQILQHQDFIAPYLNED